MKYSQDRKRRLRYRRQSRNYSSNDALMQHNAKNGNARRSNKLPGRVNFTFMVRRNKLLLRI